MTDLTPQTTPTRDEAVPIGYMRPADKDGNSFWCSRQKSAYYTDPVFASAPAPASGGVDAAAEVHYERVRLRVGAKPDGTMIMPPWEDVSPANKANQIEDIRAIAAALSPAATPVSEVGGEAEFIQAAVGLMTEGRYVAPGAVAERLYALAKPASSPAGGDVAEREVAAQAALARIKKLRDQYADQAKFADVDEARLFRQFVERLDRAALSQSTSGGRVGE